MKSKTSLLAFLIGKVVCSPLACSNVTEHSKQTLGQNLKHGKELRDRARSLLLLVLKKSPGKEYFLLGMK